MEKLSIKETVEKFDTIKQLLDIHKDMQLPYRSFCHYDLIMALKAIVNNDRESWDKLPNTTMFKRKLKKRNIVV